MCRGLGCSLHILIPVQVFGCVFEKLPSISQCAPAVSCTSQQEVTIYGSSPALEPVYRNTACTAILPPQPDLAQDRYEVRSCHPSLTGLTSHSLTKHVLLPTLSMRKAIGKPNFETGPLPRPRPLTPSPYRCSSLRSRRSLSCGRGRTGGEPAAKREAQQRR